MHEVEQVPGYQTRENPLIASYRVDRESFEAHNPLPLHGGQTLGTRD